MRQQSTLLLLRTIAYRYVYVREGLKHDFGKAKFDGSQPLLTARISWFFRSVADFFSRTGRRPRPSR